MSRAILQINYQFTSLAELTKVNTPGVAEFIAAAPGLIWKIWLLNEADREAGGIYLFESREAAEAFANSDAIRSFAAHPVIANLNAKFFAPDEAMSKITRAPLNVNVPA